MADKPILFSAPMVRALLNYSKTQTRRVLPPHIVRYGRFEGPGVFNPTIIVKGEEEPGPDTFGIWHVDGDWGSKLPIAPGDRLWVREAWTPLDALTHSDPGVQALADRGFYRADGSTVEGEISRWRPSIHMPRWASRPTLTVTDVRVQRLQDISEEDAIAEGVEPFKDGWKGYLWGKPGDVWATAVDAYHDLWDSINGAGAWDANPWVVAYTFYIQRLNIDEAW